MKKIEIITDEHRHHEYIGNIDFSIKGIKIMAASKKDAIKKYNHRKKDINR